MAQFTTIDQIKISELFKRGNGNRNGWKKWLLAIAGALLIAFFTWIATELMNAHDLQQRVVFEEEFQEHLLFSKGLVATYEERVGLLEKKL